MVSFPGCSPWPCPSPTVSEPWCFRPNPLEKLPKAGGSGQASSAGGCSRRLPQLPRRRLLLAVAAASRRFAPSLPAPRPSVDFSHVCEAGAAAPGLRGDGVGLSTPSQLGMWHGDAGRAAGALAWLQPPPALFVLRFPTCKVGRREPEAAVPAALVAAAPARPAGPIAVGSWLCSGWPEQPGGWQRWGWPAFNSGINKCKTIICSSGGIQPFLSFPWLINLMVL